MTRTTWKTPGDTIGRLALEFTVHPVLRIEVSHELPGQRVEWNCIQSEGEELQT